jgi:8-oxo-dGTP diphosphatase
MSPFGPVNDTLPVDVRAAGTVLWRPGPGGRPLVALVHRPRYDDWAFPKGKLDRDEEMPFAAVRETAEETGQRARLGARLGDVRYSVPEGLKVVRYWAAQSFGGRFIPNTETDQLVWADVDRAADQLSYRHDLEVLRRFLEVGPTSTTVLLVRHAKAGSKDRWRGDDALRPLSKSGRRQATALVPFLKLFGPERLHSAPPVRCRQTIEPLAQKMGKPPIGVEPLFGENHYWDDPSAARERLHALADGPGVTVVSSQGGVIPDLVGTIGKPVGVDPDDVPARKGSTWVLTWSDGELRSADHYPPLLD